MPLLTPPDILPEAMRFLLRAILAHPNARCPKTELLALVAPEGLSETMRALDKAKDKEEDHLESDNTATSGKLIADRSLSALISLDFAAVDAADVAASDVALRLWRDPSAVTAESFSRQLRSQIWRIANAAAGATNSYVGDLVNALAVLFATREPLRPFEFETGNGRQFANAQTEWFGFNKSDWPVTNSTQFVPFYRWAPYLGLAQPITARSLVADASSALLEELADLPRRRLRAGEFVASCAEVLPIVDGGAYSLWKSDGGHKVSPGLTMSLCQLEAAGHLTFPPAESDTNPVELTLDTAGEPIRVSHIDWHPRLSAKGHL